MDTSTKKRVFSGIQPSGEPHLGNYLGAIKNWVGLQSEYDCIFMIADYNAITVPYDMLHLHTQTINTAASLLAAGIDHTRCILFIQSYVSEHTELAWLLSTRAPVGELERMIQYKEKKTQLGIPPNGGLLMYPLLQAADILLYNTDLVPIGKDQEQHLELTRALARKFNRDFGTTLSIPEILSPKLGAKILSLQDPARKMSKTGDETISLSDAPDAIRDKIKRAVTDSGSDIRYAPDRKPAISNLMTLYHLFSGKEFPEIENEYSGKGYAEFKSDLAEVIIAGLAPIQEKRAHLLSDPSALESIVHTGAEQARAIAHETLIEVKKKMGIIA
ncbi:MAG: tryptophan--tRNA ligase [Parcubacteria group bacterium]|nr:tryptophan--tRNA ligase [Parcubacteria group bacterium]